MAYNKLNQLAKKVLQSLMSLFLVYQSYGLLTGVFLFRVESVFASIGMAFLINLFVTGIFAFAVFAWPAQRLLPQAYYKIYQPRRFKSICKGLRLELFRKALLATFWRNKQKQRSYFDGTAKGLTHLNIQSQKAEFGHIMPFVAITLICIAVLLQGMYYLAIFSMLINILFNFYPVLLQRHHRMRIQKILRLKNT